MMQPVFVFFFWGGGREGLGGKMGIRFWKGTIKQVSWGEMCVCVDR